MKKYIIFSLFISTVLCGFGQKLVALHHNGMATFFTGNSPVNDAVSAAIAGDTIYIPGGGFSIGSLYINKPLTIYGVGHHPDSTLATTNTQLSGSIYFQNGATNCLVEGFYLSGSILFGTSLSDQVVSGITISRVNFAYFYGSFDGSSVNSASNIVLKENWIRNEVYGGFCTGLIVTNNFVSQGFRYATNSLFTNNILFGGYCGGGPFSNVDNSLIQNNYIAVAHGNCWGNYYFSLCNSNHLSYNVFNGAPGFPDGTNTGSNNWFNVPTTSIFVNCPGQSFDYTYDYHLQSPSTYLGSDGSQIGIYGGVYPMKSGNVPENPHVSTKSVAPQTNAQGELNVNITVGAQNE